MTTQFTGLTSAKQVRDLVTWLANGSITGTAEVRTKQIHLMVCPPGGTEITDERIDQMPIMIHIQSDQRSMSKSLIKAINTHLENKLDLNEGLPMEAQYEDYLKKLTEWLATA